MPRVGSAAATAGSPAFASADASLGVAFGPERDHSGALTIAPSISTGFGKHATYTSLDLGRVIFAGERDFGAFFRRPRLLLIRSSAGRR